MNTRLFMSRFVAIVLSIVLLSVASAQVVSSTARGTISGADGTPVDNATVTITHMPSGSERTATTGDNGYYFQPGLRVGGPYTISVAADGYRGTEVEDVHFSPGNQVPLNIVLEPVSAIMDEITVTATMSPLRDLNNGVGSSFSAVDISNAPAIERDIIRTLLRDPLAQSQGEGNLTVAGTNSRFNGVAIDGALQTDDFGLNNDNTEGVYSSYATQRSPINLDAVESASLIASDYDVTTSGFTGGLVTLTTKSGTNEWSGSTFYYMQTDSMFGDKLKGGDTYDPGPIDEKEYGITLGGPIIEDKLFFFVSYDEFESAKTNDYTSVDASNDIAPGFFEQLGQVINSSLGYNPGGRSSTSSTPSLSERALAKLDWDISDQHRASFTYQSTEELGTSSTSTSFESSWYAAPIDLKAYTLQLYSDWNDKLSTSFRVNLKDYERGQICRAGKGVGQIYINNLDIASVVGTPLEGFVIGDDVPNITAGCDRYRHANEYNDERLQIMAKADYFIGDHVISAGLELEDFSLFNVYVPDSLGSYTYDSYSDLVSGIANVVYVNDKSNDVSKAAQSWGYKKWSLFVQDSMQISDNLELGFGLRYERFDQSDRPVFDQSVMDQYGVNTSNNLDGRDLVLPRVSFRWTPADRTAITGGIGRFAGGDPKVWTSNAFQLPVVTARTFGYAGADPTVIPQTLINAVAAGTPVPIDYIAKDFDIPSDWKVSLRLEQEFDIGSSEDYIFTAQWLYSKVEDGFQWRNLAQTALSTGVAPDGRPIYADLDDLNIPNLTELRNFSAGDNHVFSVSLAKHYDYGLEFGFSYAFQDTQVVTGANSSRGISNWRGIIGSDKNNPYPKVSPYQVEHSFKLNIGYEKDFFDTGQSTTRFDLFARRFSGDHYTNTFNVGSSNPMFGRAFNESPYDTDTLYIPTGTSDPAVVFATGFQQAAFFEYVKGDVGIVAPNKTKSSWNSTMDLRIQQEIPGLSFLGNAIGDNNFRVVLDIENLLNLINDDWGRWSDGPFYTDNDIVTADLVLASDVAANGVDAALPLLGDAPRLNCVQQSDCVYRFNSFRDRDVDFTNRKKSVYKLRLGIRFDF